MAKQIVTLSYWLGLLSFLIALVLRALSLLGIQPFPSPSPQRTLGYMSFYKGALLFLLIVIATVGYAKMRGEKAP